MVAEEQPWVWDMVNWALGAPRRHSGGYRHTRSAALRGDTRGASRAPLAGDRRGDKDDGAHLAHERSQPHVGRALVRAEPELGIVIRCHRKLEIPCGAKEKVTRERSCSARNVDPAGASCGMGIVDRETGVMGPPGPQMWLRPDGIKASPPFEATREKGLCSGKPLLVGARAWDCPQEPLCPRVAPEGGRRQFPHAAAGEGAPALTILEGVDVAKDPEPVVLPLG